MSGKVEVELCYPTLTPIWPAFADVEFSPEVRCIASVLPLGEPHGAFGEQAECGMVLPTPEPGSSWFSVVPSLPAGVTLDQVTGTISGTPLTSHAACLEYTVSMAWWGSQMLEDSLASCVICFEVELLDGHVSKFAQTAAAPALQTEPTVLHSARRKLWTGRIGGTKVDHLSGSQEQFIETSCFSRSQAGGRAAVASCFVPAGSSSGVGSSIPMPCESRGNCHSSSNKSSRLSRSLICSRMTNASQDSRSLTPWGRHFGKRSVTPSGDSVLSRQHVFPLGGLLRDRVVAPVVGSAPRQLSEEAGVCGVSPVPMSARRARIHQLISWQPSAGRYSTPVEDGGKDAGWHESCAHPHEGFNAF